MQGVEGRPGPETQAPGDLTIRLTLLGGFRAETTTLVPETAWQQRRSAKQLVKLLAAHPSHSLHREQVLELLWPEVEFSSAVNSFGKALHVARRALEPDMLSRGTSSYLRLAGDVLTLITDHVWIDADHFRAVADSALRRGDRSSLETALDLYKGELLPEDTYEGWATAARDELAELHVRLLLTVADLYERAGDSDSAIERLNQILRLDTAREDIHRRLMKLHAESGRRLLALRQYQVCCDSLERELDAQPDSETVALYDDIRADRISREERVPSTALQIDMEPLNMPAALQQLRSTPFVGRQEVLARLMDVFLAADGGRGQTIVLHGETGVGKTRLLAEAASAAAYKGALVLWGAGHDKESPLSYGPFMQALEAYAATLGFSERERLATRHPDLAGHIPSLVLGMDTHHGMVSPRAEQGRLFASIVCLLTELATQQTVVLVLDDLHTASWETVRLLHHIAHLANSRRWLILGSYREEEVAASSGLDQTLSSLSRQGFCRQILVGRFPREDAGALVNGLLELGSPSHELLQYVYATTLGNPLFITELIGALKGRGQLVIRAGTCHLASPDPDGVPLRIRKVVELHMSRMDQRSRRVLALLSVADTHLSFHQMHVAAHEVVEPNIQAADLLDILDAALESRILVERDNGYAFAHPLFRAAVYDELSSQRRQRFQGAIMGALSTAGNMEFRGPHSRDNTELQTTVAHLEHAVAQARFDGTRGDTELHLWRLLEGLQLLGRREDAEQVRQQLRTLLLETTLYNPTGQFQSFSLAKHEIA